MNWLKRFFFRRRLDKSIDAQIKAVEAGDLIPKTPPFSGPGKTEEDVSVTAQYSLLGDEIDKAIDAKRDARDAAVRVTTSIGAPPSSTPGPDRAIKIPPGK